MTAAIERILEGAAEIERAIADLRIALRSGEIERLAFRPNEVAHLLGCGRDTVRRWVAAGDIPSIREGNVILIPRAGLERWLEQRSASPAAGEGRSATSSPPAAPSRRRRR